MIYFVSELTRQISEQKIKESAFNFTQDVNKTFKSLIGVRLREYQQLCISIRCRIELFC